MDITQCKNCLNRVLPSASMVCPSCKQRVDQPSEQMVDKVVIEISPKEILPRVCISCGEPTRRQVKVSFSGKGAESTKAMNILSTISFLFVGIGVFGKSETAVRKLPSCKKCNPSHLYTPRHLDQDTHVIKVIADKDFVTALYGR